MASCPNKSYFDKAYFEGTPNVAALVQQPADAKFLYAPTVAMRCYASIPSAVWQTHFELALPAFAHKLPHFRGVNEYCRRRFEPRLWPPCSPVRSTLTKAEVFFGVLTTRRLLQSRGRIATRTLALQGARHGLFGELDLHNASGHVTLLPEAARLESMQRRRPPFIAQKVLEMLTVMHRSVKPRQTRWWVVCDDDSFVFVDRLVHLLSSVSEEQPLLVGGGQARAHLCGEGLCNFTRFVEQHGHTPAVASHAGGPAFVLNDAAMLRLLRGLHHRRCFDAPYGDTAVAACARAMGVRVAVLPGGHVINNKLQADVNLEGFTGEIISYHRLTPRRQLCWARFGECDPRCNCPCACGERRCTTALSAAEERRVKASGLSKRELSHALRKVWNCTAKHFDCGADDLEWVPGSDSVVPSVKVMSVDVAAHRTPPCIVAPGASVAPSRDQDRS